MKRREIRRKNKIRKIRRIITLLIITLIITFIFASVINRRLVAATEPTAYKYYTHIVVEEGDSLWDIAGEYMGPYYKSRKAYIKEICKINHMNSTRVFSGDTLVVPYYDTEQK